MEKKDPIKPKLSLTKKPNFKKGELENDFIFEFERDFFLPYREGNETRTYNINVGELGAIDVEEFMRKMKENTQIPQQYLDPAPIQYTSPVGISSRAIQNSDGSMDYLSWDLVGHPPKKSLLNQIKEYISDIYRKWKRSK